MQILSSVSALVLLVTIVAVQADWVSPIGGDFQRWSFQSSTIGTGPFHPKVVWTQADAVAPPALYQGSAFIVTNKQYCTLKQVNAKTGAFQYSLVLYPETAACGPPVVYASKGLVLIRLTPLSLTGQAFIVGVSISSMTLAFVGNMTGGDSVFAFGPVASQGTIFAADGPSTNLVFAFSDTDGGVVWNVSAFTPSSVADNWGVTLFGTEQVLYSTQSPNPLVGGLDASNGGDAWQWPFSFSETSQTTGWAPVALPSLNLVLASPHYSNQATDGLSTMTIQALSLATPTPAEAWNYSCYRPYLQEGQAAQPATDGASAYINCGPGKYSTPVANTGIVCLDAKAGTVLSILNCTNCIGTPVLTTNHVISLTSANKVVIFNRNSEQQEALFGQDVFAFSYDNGYLYTVNMEWTVMNAYKIDG